MAESEAHRIVCIDQSKIGCKQLRSTNVKLQLFLVFKNTELNVFRDVENLGSDDSHRNFSRTRENDVWCESRKG